MDLARRVLARFQRQAGASEFSEYIQNVDPKRAFREAVDNARHESGHGGYSGTIAEKSDFKILTRTPMSLPVARDYAYKHMGDADKWGPALAVPIGDVKVGKPVKRGLIVEAREEWLAQQEAVKQAKKLFEAKYGDNFSLKILETKRQQTTGSVQTVPQPVTKASKFFWARDKGHPSGREYSNKKDALGAFKAQDPKAFVEGETWTLLETRSIGAFRIEGGVSQNWEVVVEATPEESTGAIKGWYFFGLASS